MGQDATCIEIGLDPGDIVLDGDPDPPPKKGGTQRHQLSGHVCYFRHMPRSDFVTPAVPVTVTLCLVAKRLD